MPDITPFYTPKGPSYWRKYFDVAVPIHNSIIGTKPVQKPIDKYSYSKAAVGGQLTKQVSLYDDANRAMAGDEQAFTRLKNGLKGRDVSSFNDGELYRKFNSIEAAYNQARSRGRPVDEGNFLTKALDFLTTSPITAPVIWALDQISRPMYAAGNMIYKEAEQQKAEEARGEDKGTFYNTIRYLPIISMLGDGAFSVEHFGDAWRGLTLEERNTTSKALDLLHPEMNGLAKGVLGFALDVATDPLSYVGAGLVKGGIKGGVQVGAKVAGKDLAKATANKNAAVVDDLLKNNRSLNAIINATATSAQEGKITPELIKKLSINRGVDVGNKSDYVGQIIANTDFRDPEAIKNIYHNLQNITGSTKAQIESSAQVVTRVMIDASAKFFKDEATAHVLSTLRKEGKYLTPRDLASKSAETIIAAVKPEDMGRVSYLLKRRGQLNSLKHNPKYKSDKAYAKRIDDEYESLSKEFDSLAEKSKLKIPELISKHGEIVKTLNKDPEYAALVKKQKEIEKELRIGDPIPSPKGRKNPKSYVRDKADIPAGLDRAKYEKLIDDLHETELQIQNKIGHALSDNVTAGKLPGVKGKASGWSKNRLFQKLDEIYAKHSESMVAGPIKVAAVGKRTLAEGSKVGNTGVEAIRQELAYRAHAEIDKITKQVTAEAAKDPSIDAAAEIASRVEALKQQWLTEFGGGSKFIHGDIEDIFDTTSGPALVARPAGAAGEPFYVMDRAYSKAEIDLHAEASKKIEEEAAKAAEKYDAELSASVADTFARLVPPENRQAFALKVGFLGMGERTLLAVAAPEFIGKGIDKLAKAPVIKSTIDAFNAAFITTSGMAPELKAARAALQNRATEHLMQANKIFSYLHARTTKAERNTVYRALYHGIDSVGGTLSAAEREAYDAYTNILVELSRYMRPGALPDWEIGHLQPSDIAAYMPKRKFVVMENIATTEIPKSTDPAVVSRWMLHLVAEGKEKNFDPSELIHALTYATIRAESSKTLMSTIAKTFGIRRFLDQDSIPLAHRGEVGKAEGAVAKPRKIQDRIEDPIASILLHEHGYVANPELGLRSQYIFEPEIARQISKVADLLKPIENGELVNHYDSVMRIWKKSVTVYNVPFHVRNSIGDVMVGVYDGVIGPSALKSYGLSGRIIKKMMGRDKGAPAMDVIDIRLNSSKVLFTTKHGSFTEFDIWNTFNQTGLKSGFVTTDFLEDYVGRGNKLTQNIQKIGNAVDTAAGHREDYFRLAHFIHALKRGDSVDDAAQAVRKYHFDYSEYTPLEKKVFVRFFPFYKWTRKALPLLTTQAFMKPGITNVYMHAGQNVQGAAGYGYTGPGEADEVTPKSFKDQVAWAMGADTQGNTLYGRMAVPQNDVLSDVMNPGGAAAGMLNPALKVLVEQTTGVRVGGDVGGAPLQPQDRGFEGIINSFMPPAVTNTNKAIKSEMPSWANLLNSLGLATVKPNDRRMTMAELQRIQRLINTDTKNARFQMEREGQTVWPNS